MVKHLLIYVCKDCNTVYNDEKSAVDHNDEHNHTCLSKSYFQCNHCDLKHISRVNICLHEKRKHGEYHT